MFYEVRECEDLHGKGVKFFWECGPVRGWEKSREAAIRAVDACRDLARAAGPKGANLLRTLSDGRSQLAPDGSIFVAVANALPIARGAIEHRSKAS